MVYHQLFNLFLRIEIKQMYVRILFNNIYIVDERKVTMNDT